MKAIAVCMVLLGCIAFWSERRDRASYEAAGADALALNYGIFRNAVFAYAHSVKAEGTLLPDHPALKLPAGWVASRSWRGLIRREEDGELYCYVFGPARPSEVSAIWKAFRDSLAIGWNDSGFLARNGSPLPLPEGIPDGAVVSVVRID